MRDVMREYEWYYRNRSRRILKIHVLVTTYEALIKDYEVSLGSFPRQLCSPQRDFDFLG